MAHYTQRQMQDGVAQVSEVQIEVGMGLTQYVGSDCSPFRVTAVLGEKRIEVKRVAVKCISHDNQEYEYGETTGQPVLLTRRSNGLWQIAGQPSGRGYGWGFGQMREYRDPSF